MVGLRRLIQLNRRTTLSGWGARWGSDHFGGGVYQCWITPADLRARFDGQLTADAY